MSEIVVISRQELTDIVIQAVKTALEDTPPPPHMPALIPQQQAELSPYISKREACRLLDCSPSTIGGRAREGSLKRYYVGKSVRFDRQEVLSLAKPSENYKAKRGH